MVSWLRSVSQRPSPLTKARHDDSNEARCPGGLGAQHWCVETRPIGGPLLTWVRSSEPARTLTPLRVASPAPSFSEGIRGSKCSHLCRRVPSRDSSADALAAEDLSNPGERRKSRHVRSAPAKSVAVFERCKVTSTGRRLRQTINNQKIIGYTNEFKDSIA
jgi:hypothetical protein